ncbi:hypothetical protein [Cellulosilyticum ruminicola]|uniref:hypothetical protein n=1 Tax=Cellulosilyticum ruminicola TaxID=425254 RepID=UPI002E8E5EBB|nr:hypothetical protein [Cellulosilyticum ruminicola]
MMTEFNIEQFLMKYPYAMKMIEENNINIANLKLIYKDYIKHMDAYQNHGDFIANILRSQNSIHTVKSRLKDPDGLLKKLFEKQKIAD